MRGPRCVEVTLAIAEVLFCIILFLFAVLPSILEDDSLAGGGYDYYSTTLCVVLYLLLLVQFYLILYEVIWKNLNRSIIRVLVWEYDVFMLFVLSFIYLSINCIKTIHVWNIPVALYLLHLLLVFCGFDLVYPHLSPTKTFRVLFIIVYLYTIAIIYSHTFYDKKSRDVAIIHLDVRYSQTFYYQSLVRSIILPFLFLSLNPLKNIIDDVINMGRLLNKLQEKVAPDITGKNDNYHNIDNISNEDKNMNNVNNSNKMNILFKGLQKTMRINDETEQTCVFSEESLFQVHQMRGDQMLSKSRSKSQLQSKSQSHSKIKSNTPSLKEERKDPDHDINNSQSIVSGHSGLSQASLGHSNKSVKSIKQTHNFSQSSKFYFLQCNVYKVSPSIEMSQICAPAPKKKRQNNVNKKINIMHSGSDTNEDVDSKDVADDSVSFLSKNLTNSVTIQKLSANIQIAITSNDAAFQQFKSKWIDKINNNNSHKINASLMMIIGQWVCSLTFTSYMTLVMTAHFVTWMVSDILLIVCWTLLSLTYLGLFLSLYKNINPVISKKILIQPKVLALLFLHGMHVFTDVKYGWSIIALPDCIEGSSFILFFFGFDATKTRVHQASRIASLAFFLATLIDAVISLLDTDSSIKLFSILGYDFYEAPMRFSIFLSMSILSGKALWTMTQDKDRLVWVLEPRKKAAYLRQNLNANQT